MKQKILIIEDDPTIQTQLKTLLSGNGYEARAVTDFSKVMEQFKAFAPILFYWISNCRETTALKSAHRSAAFPIFPLYL